MASFLLISSIMFIIIDKITEYVYNYKRKVW